MTTDRDCDVCRDGWGWMCERHKDKSYGHDKCKCPGMPCKACFGQGGYPGIPDGAIVLASVEPEEAKEPWEK